MAYTCCHCPLHRRSVIAEKGALLPMIQADCHCSLAVQDVFWTEIRADAMLSGPTYQVSVLLSIKERTRHGNTVRYAAPAGVVCVPG